MSQRNVYIREEDEAKWKALPNKSEFIHNALNRTGIMVGDKVVQEIKINKPKPIKTKQDAEKVIEAKGWSGPIPKTFSARKKK